MVWLAVEVLLGWRPHLPGGRDSIASESPNLQTGQLPLLIITPTYLRWCYNKPTEVGMYWLISVAVTPWQSQWVYINKKIATLLSLVINISSIIRFDWSILESSSNSIWFVVWCCRTLALKMSHHISSLPINHQSLLKLSLVWRAAPLEPNVKADRWMKVMDLYFTVCTALKSVLRSSISTRDFRG